MKICLNKDILNEYLGPYKTEINTRLPIFIKSPCELQYSYQLSKQSDYYLIDLDLTGNILITCQRCLGEFKYEYKNQSKVAVCSNEKVAERLMLSFECIVSRTNEIDLNEVITDELHLFCDERHADFADCDDNIKQLIK